MVYNNPIVPNIIKSYKNYLQNTQHMVLRNRPTLIIGTERLACLNSPPALACSGGPSPSTRQVPGSSPGRAARAFSLHPFLPPSGDSFFRTFPTNPAKVLLGLNEQSARRALRASKITLGINVRPSREQKHVSCLGFILANYYLFMRSHNSDRNNTVIALYAEWCSIFLYEITACWLII